MKAFQTIDRKRQYFFPTWLADSDLTSIQHIALLSQLRQLYTRINCMNNAKNRVEGWW